MQDLAYAFDVQLSDGRLDVYWRVLSRYPEPKLRRALREALENETRFPSIADIRKYIEPLTDPMSRPKKVPVYE